MSIHDNFRLIELPTEEVDGLNAIEKVTPFRECTPVWTGIGIPNRNKMHILMSTVVTRAYNLGTCLLSCLLSLYFVHVRVNKVI